MKKIAISQSNYIPWRGYFDMIASVDEFVLYDDMQFTKRDWRNRNTIKTPNGLHWMSVPVKVKGRYEQKIKDTLIDNQEWSEKHFKMFQLNYKRSTHFDEVITLLEPIYINEQFTHLSQLNYRLIQLICEYLGITTKLTFSMDYHLIEGKTERLADICIQAGANEYISGPAAKEYIDSHYFTENNIKLTWFNYSGYANYPQLWGEFVPNVSILDLLFNCGQQANQFLRRNLPHTKQPIITTNDSNDYSN